MNPGRVLVVATNVFREVIRDRVLYLIGVFAGVMVLGNFLLPEVAAGTEDKILLDLGLAGISILGLIVAVFVGTGLINKEIEKRTVFVLIAKPVKRSEFILGKHLGLSALLAVLLAAMTGIYLGVLHLGQVEYPLVSILIAVGFLFLQLSLVTAIAIVFGVFTSSLLATLLTFGTYLMGMSTQDLVALGKLSENPTVQLFTQGLYVILPDLSRLDLKNQAVYGLQLLPNSLQLAENLVYALIYTVLLLTIAAFTFSQREF